MRRYFNEALPVENPMGSPAYELVELIDELFSLERFWATLSATDRLKKRNRS